MRQTRLLRQLQQLSTVRCVTQTPNNAAITNTCLHATTAPYKEFFSSARQQGGSPPHQDQQQLDGTLVHCLREPTEPLWRAASAAWPLQARPGVCLPLQHTAGLWQRQQQRPFSSKKSKKGKKATASKQQPGPPQPQHSQPAQQQQQQQRKPVAKQRPERPKHFEVLQENEPLRAAVRKRHEVVPDDEIKQPQLCKAVPTPEEADLLRTRMQIAAMQQLMHANPHTSLLSPPAPGIHEVLSLEVAKFKARLWAWAERRVKQRILFPIKAKVEELDSKAAESGSSSGSTEDHASAPADRTSDSSSGSSDSSSGSSSGSSGSSDRSTGSGDGSSGDGKPAEVPHAVRTMIEYDEFLAGARQAVQRVLELHGAGDSAELADLVSPHQRNRMVAEHEHLASKGLYPLSCDAVDVHVLLYKGDDAWMPASAIELLMPGAQRDADALAQKHAQQQQAQQAQAQTHQLQAVQQAAQQRQEQQQRRVKQGKARQGDDQGERGEPNITTTFWRPLWLVRAVVVLASHSTTFAKVEVSRQEPASGTEEAELRPPEARPRRATVGGVWLFVRGPVMVEHMAFSDAALGPGAREVFGDIFEGARAQWMKASPWDTDFGALDWRVLATLEDRQIVLSEQRLRQTAGVVVDGTC